MGIVAQSEAGTAAILYYLAGYLFALITIFLIINLLTKEGEGEDISCLENLNNRSPLVGVSSYLLIGFWFEKPSAADAAKKAFLTNRVGDFGFLIGILIYVLSSPHQ